MRHLFLLTLIAVLPTGVAGQSRGFHMEHALGAGGVLGVNSKTGSPWRAISELGYMLEGRPHEDGTGWGGGGTFFLGVDGEHGFYGMKPRLRYRFSPQWSLDLSAGMIFNSTSRGKSFIGGVHLNKGKWWTVRADVNVRRADPLGRTYSYIDPGNETAVHFGLALRDKAGWIAMGATLVGGFLLLAANLDS